MNGKKSFKLLPILLFGMVLGACGPEVEPHVCEHVCDICGGCLDATCEDPECATKCPTHTLTAPTVTLTENVASWGAVEHATGYEVFVNETSKGNQQGLSYTITATDVGSYVVKVVAKGNGANVLDSAKSAGVTYVINPTMFTVEFKNGETVLQSGSVEEGQKASYTGDTPTKEATETEYFEFSGWDKSLDDPITANTVFNATFTPFAKELVIDTFESYADKEAVNDVWEVKYHNGSAWTDPSSAFIDVGHMVNDESAKSGLLYIPMNGYNFRFGREITVPTQSVMGIKFTLKTEEFASLVVRFEGSINLPVKGETAFYVDEKINTVGTNAFVDYVMPITESWIAWRGTDAAITLADVKNAYGINPTDICKYINKVEFIIGGNDNVGGRKYYCFLDNVSFVSGEEVAAKRDEAINVEKVYTFAGGDDVVRFTTGADAKFETLTREQNICVPGSTSVSGNTITFTSADQGASFVYNATIKNGGKKLVTGECAGTYAQIGSTIPSFDAVTVVEDFNSYPVTGKMAQQADFSDGVGIGKAYYADYYSGSGSSPVGGTNWSLLGGDGSQMKIKNDGTKLDGTNYVCMKRGSAGAMRYMTMNLANGTGDAHEYRGSTLSFWYMTKTGTISAKVRAYFNTAVNPSNQGEGYKGNDSLSLTHSAEWQHVEIAIDPTIVYHGICFVLNASGSDDFLYVDNIEIYNANPYAKYVAPVEPIEPVEEEAIPAFSQLITTVNSNPAIITTGAEGACKLEVPAMSMKATGTYEVVENTVTFSFGDDLTYVGTIDEATGNVAKTSASGTYGPYFTGNFTMGQMLDNMESYTESGVMYSQNAGASSRSGARGAYFCDYYSGGSGSPVGGNGWSLMGGNADQLSLVNNDGHSGTNPIKIKCSSAGNMRYMTYGLYDGTAEGHTGVHYIAMWVKNLSASSAKFKGYAYYQQTVTASTQQLNRTDIPEITLEANGEWQLIIVQLDATKTYYGVAMFGCQAAAERWIAVDDICFF